MMMSSRLKDLQTGAKIFSIMRKFIYTHPFLYSGVMFCKNLTQREIAYSKPIIIHRRIGCFGPLFTTHNRKLIAKK